MRMPGQGYKKVCIVCGKRFAAMRSHAKCCSASCRTVLNREGAAAVNEVILETGGPVKKIEDLVASSKDLSVIHLKPFDVEKRYRYRLGSLGAPMNSAYKRYLFFNQDSAVEYAKQKGWFAEYGKDLIIEGTSVYVPDGWSSRSWNR